jgi:polysaccharide biosynthesis transport protein
MAHVNTDPGLLPLIRRRWRLLGAAVIASALVGFVGASLATKTYEAQTRLLVGPVNAEYGTLQAAGQLGRTYAELARSVPVVQAAARQAGVQLSREEAEKAVVATSNEITRIVELRVRNADPGAAARIANALNARLIGLRRELPPQDSEPVDELMREDEVASLSAGQQDGVRRAARRVLGRTNAGLLEVIDRADAPRAPVAPRVGLIVLLAALAGGLAALAFAIVTERGGWESELDDLELAELVRGYNGSETAGSGARDWVESRGEAS